MDQPKTHAQNLADYIKKNLRKGYTLDSLKFSLITQGYSKISVENAIDISNKQLAKELPEVKEKPQITYKITAEDLDSGESKSEIIQVETKKGFWKSLFS
jgi:hypothetical protein